MQASAKALLSFTVATTHTVSDARASNRLVG